MMDEEEREALEMSDDDLNALWDSGKRVRVAKMPPRRIRKDLDQAAASVVAQATDERPNPSERVVVATDLDSVRFDGPTIVVREDATVKVLHFEGVVIQAGTGHSEAVRP